MFVKRIIALENTFRTTSGFKDCVNHCALGGHEPHAHPRAKQPAIIKKENVSSIVFKCIPQAVRDNNIVILELTIKNKSIFTGKCNNTKHLN